MKRSEFIHAATIQCIGVHTWRTSPDEVITLAIDLADKMAARVPFDDVIDPFEQSDVDETGFPSLPPLPVTAEDLLYGFGLGSGPSSDMILDDTQPDSPDSSQSQDLGEVEPEATETPQITRKTFSTGSYYLDKDGEIYCKTGHSILDGKLVKIRVKCLRTQQNLTLHLEPEEGQLPLSHLLPKELPAEVVENWHPKARYYLNPGDIKAGGCYLRRNGTATIILNTSDPRFPWMDSKWGYTGQGFCVWDDCGWLEQKKEFDLVARLF